MSTRTIGVSESVHRYLTEHSGEHSVLAELRAETAPLEWARMQIAPDQGAFMAWLVRLIDARRTLEVGVFTGYSSLAVALALPPEGRIVACDVSEEWTRMARRYWEKAGVSQKIELRLKPALETLDELLRNGEARSFDFAFIDADKENYLAYYERSLELVRAGGVIAIDNTLWSGAVADPLDQRETTVAIRQVNERVLGDARVQATLATVGDGLLLATKR
jgi:caffeoyl-CoA O-methyltransferase